VGATYWSDSSDMRIQYQFRDGQSSGAFRQHAQPRLENLSKFSDRITTTKVVVSQQRNWYIVEITVDADGALIRGEERSDELLTSFDKALARVERQLRSYTERLQEKGRQTLRNMPTPRGAVDQEELAEEGGLPQEDNGDDIRIVKTKSHALKPMTPEEAALQMELIGHNFFMFFNGESEQINVVYRRDDGDYGLIEPAIQT